MEHQREKLRNAAARNRAVDDYNAAIELYNQRDYERALAAFRKLAAEGPEPDIAAAGREKAPELTGRSAKPKLRPGA